MVSAEEAGQRLDNFIQRRLAKLPRSRIYRIIRKGEVRVNGHRAAPDTRLQAEDKIRIPPVRLATGPGALGRPSAEQQLRIERSIVHEDRDVLVLDKPAGLAVHGGSGLAVGVIEALRAARPAEYLELVHRLDRDTSGCLLVARNSASLRALHALLREGAFEKRYLALLKGRWELGRKRIDVPLRTDIRVGGERTVKAHASGKPSVSEFRPVQLFGKRASLMEVILRTGRTHQIRVHAQHAGHPVAGDEKYGDEAFNRALSALGLKRMFLHAHSVSFEREGAGEVSFSAPLPPELAALLDSLSKEGARAVRQGTR
jgi:23S rRNA pseudouridine955/2504/2580 synthase